jgi:hypothetical protein
MEGNERRSAGGLSARRRGVPGAAVCRLAAAILCLAAARGGLAEDEATVVLPPSDVVAGGLPYRIGVKAGKGLAARNGQATIVLRRQEPGLEPAK